MNTTDEKLEAISNVLNRIEKATAPKSEVATVLKKIERNTASLRKGELSMMQRQVEAVRSTIVRSETPRHKSVDAGRQGIATDKPRDDKGGFVSEPRIQDPEGSDRPERRGIFARSNKHSRGNTGRGISIINADAIKEAAGRAILGPAYDAVAEIGSMIDYARDEDTMAGRVIKSVRQKFAERKDRRVEKAEVAKKEPDAAIQDAVVTGFDDHTDKIIDALMKGDMDDEVRHKELTRVILAAGKKQEQMAKAGLTTARKTGPGARAADRRKRDRQKGIAQTAYPRRGQALPKVPTTPTTIPSTPGPAGAPTGQGDGGFFGNLSKLVPKLGRVLGAVPLGTVGAIGGAGAIVGGGIIAKNSDWYKNLQEEGKKYYSGQDINFQRKYDANFADTVQEAASKNGVSEDFMKTMLHIENAKLDPNAVSSTGAKGLYQFVSGTAKQYGIAGREFDAQANIRAAGRLAASNKRDLEKRGIATTDSNLYMAHQLGVGKVGGGGLVDLLNATQTGVASAALRKQMDVNGGKGMTPADFHKMWQTKYTKNAMQAGAYKDVMTASGKGQTTPSETKQQPVPVPAVQVAKAEPTGAKSLEVDDAALAQKVKEEGPTIKKKVYRNKGEGMEIVEAPAIPSPEAQIAEAEALPKQQSYRNKGEGMEIEDAEPATTTAGKPPMWIWRPEGVPAIPSPEEQIAQAEATPRTGYRNKGEGMEIEAEKPVIAHRTFVNKGDADLTTAIADPENSTGFGVKPRKGINLTSLVKGLLKGDSSEAKQLIPKVDVTALAKGAIANPASMPERLYQTADTMAGQIGQQAQGVMQGGMDMGNSFMASIEKLNKGISKMAGTDETQKPGVPVIRTEFDDTLLTLMAYDRI